MNILHINSNYAYSWLHQKMQEHLGTDNVKNTVFVPVSRDLPPKVIPNDNVTVVKCFGKYDRYVFDHKQNKIIKALNSSMKAADFDLVHAYTLFTDGNCARRIAKKNGIPYVVAVRNVDVNIFFKMAFYLRSRGIKILRDASAVFFLSDSYKKEVLDSYVPVNLREEIDSKSYIIPNGIDDFWLENTPGEATAEMRRTHITDKKINIVYAGRIDKNKNIGTTQKAMDILREKGYEPKLTVIGSVSDQSEYERVISDAYTEYHPAVPKEELIGCYRENDIFVMPSIHETFGLVYAEALSQGLPVVYSKGQGFDGQFPEGQVGYSASSGSPEEVADAIEKICANFAEISERTVGASKKFDWTTLCKKYRRIYADILQVRETE